MGPAYLAKTISKNHCTIAYRSGAWEITDHSTNGTYLNREPKPLLQHSRVLNDGDWLHFSPYEIEIHIEQEATIAPSPLDPLQLGADYDPIAPECPNLFDELPPQADHTSSVEDAFRPPPVCPKEPPDDWDNFDAALESPPSQPSTNAPDQGTPRPRIGSIQEKLSRVKKPRCSIDSGDELSTQAASPALYPALRRTAGPQTVRLQQRSLSSLEVSCAAIEHKLFGQTRRSDWVSRKSGCSIAQPF